MNIAILQHMAHEGPGSIVEWADTRGYTTQIHHLYRAETLPDADNFDMLVVLGGDMSVHDKEDHPWLPAERGLILRTLAAGKRVAGICLGAQQIALALGAAVYPNDQREVGFWPIQRVSDTPLIPDTLTVLHWHGDTFDLPQGATLLASSEACRNQIFLAAEGKALGLQCHVESTTEMVQTFCREDTDYLIPPPGQGRWMQNTPTMLAEQVAYAPMHATLFNLLDALNA